MNEIMATTFNLSGLSLSLGDRELERESLLSFSGRLVILQAAASLLSPDHHDDGRRHRSHPRFGGLLLRIE